MTEGALIGIDVGGTNCRGAQVFSEGRVGPLRRFDTLAEQGLESFLARLESFIREQIADRQEQPIVGVGLGVPGIISLEGIVLESPNLHFLDRFPLADVLTDRLSLPVTVVNDVNAIGWGEGRYGAGRNLDSFVCLSLGTGVGGALVLQRSLWTGADGSAGEIGHMMVEENGRLCGCGARGCLEQYASASGIVKTVLEHRRLGRSSRLNHIPDQHLTGDAVAIAARAGDESALAAYALAGSKLGQVLAGVANLLDLDGAIITGGASATLDLMRPALDEEFRRRCFFAPAQRLAIVRGDLGDIAGVVGAALLASPA